MVVPIVGTDKVVRLILGMMRQMREIGATVELHRINGQPGAIIRGPQGGVTTVFSIEIVDGRVSTIRSIVNPDKLGHLGRVENLRELVQRAGDRGGHA